MKRLIPHAFVVLSAISLLLANPVQAQTCSLMPIALSARAFDGAQPGDVLREDFGWLSWTGRQGERTLLESLLAPGNSDTYTNPGNADDHEVNMGDWVRGSAGDSNSRPIRRALDALIGDEIVVPVVDRVRGHGGRVTYRVSDFVVVQIVSYNLSRDRIVVRFVGYADCGSLPPPV